MSGKDIVFVLGSGRSGSSALTRVLSFCGCTLPQAVFGADEGNPRGFWEPADAATLNIEFLLRHGWMTVDSTWQPYEWIASQKNEKEDFIRQIRAFLATCTRGPVLVIKEPLINYLKEFWFDAARREGFSVKIVILIRHPHEVIASGTTFAPTIGFVPQSIANSSVWWLRTNLSAERLSRGFPRVFVQHSRLMDDWRVEIERISNELSINLQVDETAVDGFLTRDLHRKRLPGPTVEIFGYSWISRVYDILSVAAEDGPIDVPALDDVYYAYRACAPVLTELRRGFDLQSLREYFKRRPVWQFGRDF